MESDFPEIEMFLCCYCVVNPLHPIATNGACEISCPLTPIVAKCAHTSFLLFIAITVPFETCSQLFHVKGSRSFYKPAGVITCERLLADGLQLDTVKNSISFSGSLLYILTYTLPVFLLSERKWWYSLMPLKALCLK